MADTMSPALSERFHAWLADRADEAVLRWLFRGILVVIVTALVVDLARLNGWLDAPDTSTPGSEVHQQDAPASDQPSLLAPLLKRLVTLPQPDRALAAPVTFELRGGGRLMASGTITPGSARAFEDEVNKHSEYIKTVVLNSPGGSVTDALAIGRLIRTRKFATEVEPGKYCASSCPLAFAGGVERRAGERAMIGVHQVAAMTTAASAAPRDDMSLAQNISARCQHHLIDMGVNPQVWVHAMETPHEKLFVFKPDELKSLNLVTAPPESAPEKARP
jgi:hypothetical protein